jgi:bla regulator protein blaR1
MKRIGRDTNTKSEPMAFVFWGLAIAIALTAGHNRAIAQSNASETELDSSHLPAWQIAAGTRSEFEVASIRLEKPDTFQRPNMVLNSEDTPVPPGGRFIADFPLEIYIEFAYKIMPTREQEDAMFAHLPKWVSTDRFVIEAEAPGHPTKDQIRLMMQSLLADRFKLAVHFETREIPVFALVADKPGKLGPGIRPHTQGLPCDKELKVPSDRTSSTIPPGGFIAACGRVQMIDGANHTKLLGGRDISIDHLAGYLPDFEDVGRPIVDETNLKGTFDFSLSWSPEGDAASPAENNRLANAEGPPLVEAIKEQLGLKLKSTKARIQVPVIDHVEPLTPN